MKIQDLAIYDNGGRTYDRYTVVDLSTKRNNSEYDCLCLSIDCDQPTGFSQFNIIDMNSNLIGDDIEFRELPENVREHIKTRFDIAAEIDLQLPETELSEYEIETRAVLQHIGADYGFKFLEFGYHFDDDTHKRNIYEFRISIRGRSYTGKYGDSVMNTDVGTKPGAYDLITALTWYDPGTYQDFCADFGYDYDSRKAYKTYKAVRHEYQQLVGCSRMTNSINYRRYNENKSEAMAADVRSRVPVRGTVSGRIRGRSQSTYVFSHHS